MRVHLDYGERGLDVDLPDGDVTVIEPEFVPGLPDERAALIDALRRPLSGPSLATLVRPGQKAVVVFSDLTRPVPNGRILPLVLSELADAGLASSDVTLLNATGLHRPNTQAELESMLGPDIVREYRVVNHDGSDRSRHAYLGQSPHGGDIWLDREYLQADLRILTGFIEPHFFAGFSGGAKSLLPGIAAEASILHNHNSEMIGHPKARWGVTEGNPILEDNRHAAELAPPSFILNVTMNREKQITGVFAGALAAAHDAGCDFVRRTAMRPSEHPFDVVVTTNSGYPLDLNVYQAVKGMSAAAQVTRDGGSIVIASECREGLGQPSFEKILRMGASPGDLLDVISKPGFQMADQWEVQALAEILVRCQVYVYSDRLSDSDASLAQLEPIRDVGAKVRDLVNGCSSARVGVLPQGPLTIPYLTAL